MNRPARTLTRDLVRRRHPTGASPSRRSAPGRTLSPMPSEQKGAYGGHLALLSFAMERTTPRRCRMCTPLSSLPETPEGRFSVERQTATRIFNRIREAPDPAPIRGPRRRPSRTPADVARGHRGGSAGGLSWAAPTPLRHEAPNVGAPIRRERPPERPPSDAFRMVLPEDRVG